jgi:hypothetical protein
MRSLVPVDYRTCYGRAETVVEAVELGEGCNWDWVRLMMRNLDSLV